MDYFHYFCAKDSGNADQLKNNEPKRLRAAIKTVLAAHAQRLKEAPVNTAEGTPAIYAVDPPDVDDVTDLVLELAKHQNDY